MLRVRVVWLYAVPFIMLDYYFDQHVTSSYIDFLYYYCLITNYHVLIHVFIAIHNLS